MRTGEIIRGAGVGVHQIPEKPKVSVQAATASVEPKTFTATAGVGQISRNGTIKLRRNGQWRCKTTTRCRNS